MGRPDRAPSLDLPIIAFCNIKSSSYYFLISLLGYRLRGL